MQLLVLWPGSVSWPCQKPASESKTFWKPSLFKELSESISSWGRVFSPETQACSFIQACSEICKLLGPCNKYSHRVVWWIRKIVTHSKNCNSFSGYWSCNHLATFLTKFSKTQTKHIHIGYWFWLEQIDKHFLSFSALNDLNLQYHQQAPLFLLHKVKIDSSLSDTMHERYQTTLLAFLVHINSTCILGKLKALQFEIDHIKKIQQ